MENIKNLTPDDVEYWEILIRSIIIGDFHSEVLDCGSAWDVVDLHIEAYDHGRAVAETISEKALERVIDSYSPLALRDNYEVYIILDMMDAKRPDKGFWLLVELLKNWLTMEHDPAFDELTSYTVRLVERALKVLENYMSVGLFKPKVTNLERKAVVNILKGFLTWPRYRVHAARLLIELGEESVDSELIAKLMIKNPDILHEMIPQIIRNRTPEHREEDLSMIYGLCREEPLLMKAFEEGLAGVNAELVVSRSGALPTIFLSGGDRIELTYYLQKPEFQKNQFIEMMEDARRNAKEERTALPFAVH